jgi:S-adenosylmethionine hydrolase
MQSNPVITLTTDFGLNDPFVGVMKGAILSISPEANIIDLSHGIASHDIREAAFTVGMNYKFFPERTVHVVVVDPGVGLSLLLLNGNISSDRITASFLTYIRRKHERSR